MDDSNAFLKDLFPSGRDIYDALMGNIEPELTSANVGLLQNKYANETTEERSSRMERYKKAFKQYEKEYKQWIKTLRKDMATIKKGIVKRAETHSNTQDQDQISALEGMLS